MKRLAAITLWILAGSALTGGVYWAFLNTPESTIWTLILSALLAAMALVFAAITLNGAIAAWSQGLSRESLRGSPWNVPAIFPALIIVVATWWLADRATDWVTLHNGPINAEFIARFGWDDMSWLFTAITWFSRWLRWVVAPLLALSLVAAVLAAGWTAAARIDWIRRALSPLRLILATLWFGALVAAPWIYIAPWRPRGLPASSIEIAFIAAKLAITAVLMAAGSALVVREASRS